MPNTHRTTPQSSRAARFGLTTLSLAATLMMWGCQRESYVYRSYTHLPQTVSLVDTAKGETLWTYEIPVGQQLSVAFMERPEKAEAAGFDTMEWSVASIGGSAKGSRSTMRVPPPSSRALNLDVRAVPEVRNVSTPDTVAPQPMTPSGPQPSKRTDSAVPAKPVPQDAGASTNVTPKTNGNGSKPKKNNPNSDVILPDPKQAAPK